MQIWLTERFLKDFQGLSDSLAGKCGQLMRKLKQIEPAALRQNVLPGWRLHSLRGSSVVSVLVYMNFRA